MGTRAMVAAVQTVPGALASRAGLEPDRVAIETSGVDRLTFAEWDRRATAVAAGLLDRGLRPGDRVALPFGAPDWTGYAVAYCGVLRAGGVAVPCADRLPPPEFAHVLDHSGAVGVLHGSVAVPAAGPRWSVSVAGCEHDPVDLPPVRPAHRAQILYTSGTTDRPKGVVASHANLTAGFATDPRRRGLAHSDHFAHGFPIGTNAAQTMLLGALDHRAGALALPRWTPARFARLIAGRRVGTVFLVPAMAVELLRSGALDGLDLSGVLLLGCTAAPLPPAVATALARAFPAATIVNYYTSTEAAPAQTSMVFDPARPDSVGRGPDGAVRIADPAGDPVPPGEPGEVWLRSPYPRAYFGDDAASGAVFRAGWVRMGDLGRLSADGYLYLLDRPQDVIKSGAYKVSTLHVEAALHEHPAVVEAAAFGVPHPVLGEVVAAALVTRAAVSRGELRAFLAGRLADHELPARVVTVQRLPRNRAGKVRKRDLPGLLDLPADPPAAGDRT